MRAHGLLSPHRGRQGAAKTHDGRVITQAPNVMWGTDGVRVFTLDDGWGWIFAESNTGTRSAWGGTCAKSGASRHSMQGRCPAMARVEIYRLDARTKQTPAAGLLRALWEATDREAVNEYDAMIATHRQTSQDHLGRSSWKNRVENQLCRCRIPDGHDSHWLRTARLEAIVGLVAN